MGRPAKEIKNTPFLIRIEPQLMQDVNRVARVNDRSTNNQIARTLKLSLGYKGLCPAIVKSDSDIYFVLPLGTYGKISGNTFKRFVIGAMPIGTKRWDESFNTAGEAIDSIGQLVCEFTDAGVRIVDFAEFIQMCKEMKVI